MSKGVSASRAYIKVAQLRHFSAWLFHSCTATNVNKFSTINSVREETKAKIIKGYLLVERMPRVGCIW